MIEIAFMILSILIVLTCLGMCFSIWWMLVSGEVQEYRRAYRDMMRRYTYGLRASVRKWLEEE